MLLLKILLVIFFIGLISYSLLRFENFVQNEYGFTYFGMGSLLLVVFGAITGFFSFITFKGPDALDASIYGILSAASLIFCWYRCFRNTPSKIAFVGILLQPIYFIFLVFIMLMGFLISPSHRSKR